MVSVPQCRAHSDLSSHLGNDSMSSAHLSSAAPSGLRCGSSLHCVPAFTWAALHWMSVITSISLPGFLTRPAVCHYGTEYLSSNELCYQILFICTRYSQFLKRNKNLHPLTLQCYHHQFLLSLGSCPTSIRNPRRKVSMDPGPAA